MVGKPVLRLSPCFSETASKSVKWGACRIISYPLLTFYYPMPFLKATTHALQAELQPANTRSSQEFSQRLQLI